MMQESETRQLVHQMQSRDNRLAREAVKLLRENGWLEDGSLRGATLANANLFRADLKQADLTAANLHRANLMCADLRGAQLGKATLQQAHLAGALLTDAHFDSQTILPDSTGNPHDINDPQHNKWTSDSDLAQYTATPLPCHLRYYSQHGEDYLLWRLFAGEEKHGYFVDVGAFDGIHLSNSFSFERQGWTGICIEPHPTFAALCRQHRTGSLTLEMACVDNPHITEVDFYAETLGLLSGTVPDRDDDIRARYENRSLDFAGFDKISVPAATLTHILDSHLPPNTSIDFLSIDVEEAENAVLDGLDLNKYRPRVIILEANSPASKKHLEDHLQSYGYTLARQLAVNLFFAHSPQDIATLAQSSVYCTIEPHLHPLGEAYSITAIAKGKLVKVGGN